MTTASFVLVPGYWLGGWAWDRVVPRLRTAGHQVTAVTLPGLEPTNDDRAAVTLEDQLTALSTWVERAGPDVLLVAHSGAGKIVSGVLDRHPEAVRRVVYVDSGPSSDGSAAELPPEVTELPLPSWEELTANGSRLEGLSPADLETFRSRAVPQPAGPAREPLRLVDPLRRRVPATIVACSFPSEVIQQMAAGGHPMFAEVAELSDLGYVDFPTGHWPMWSRPEDLADVLVELAD